MSIFNQVEKTKVRSNVFNLSHDVKLSTSFGRLTPVLALEALPGDRFDLQGNAMVRLAPLTAPVMHTANVYIHYFFVPNRIMWPEWEDFITGGQDGTLAPVHPFVEGSAQAIEEGSLGDYLGVPAGTDWFGSGNVEINAFPFCAYNKIYNEYYRDETFMNPVLDELNSGWNDIGDFVLQQRAWEKDYFTSALPWTQRGVEALLPLGSAAPIVNKLDPNGDFYPPLVKQLNGNAVGSMPLYGSNPNDELSIGSGGTPKVTMFLNRSHEVDLSQATAASINDLRRAIKLQEWLEKNARGGYRYIETLYSHFGTAPSDARLQRPEYIGGVKSPIKISEVLQTSMTDDNVPDGTPQGNMAGHGISFAGSQKYSYKVQEHGWIMGIMSILPKSAYQQGIPRKFFKLDKFDYAFPSFAHIGEQPIYQSEVRAIGGDNAYDVWGYTPRYAEYKTEFSRVASQFRNSLSFWHMGRKFSGLPALSANFIRMTPEEVNHIFAVEDPNLDNIWVQVVNGVKVARKLPVFGSPKF